MFIDNAVALSALIHGYARSTDMAYMSNAFHMQLAGLRTSVYLDYVPSKANIADLQSGLFLLAFGPIGLISLSAHCAFALFALRVSEFPTVRINIHVYSIPSRCTSNHLSAHYWSYST